MRLSVHLLMVISCISMFFSTEAIANCPDANDVTFSCETTPSGKHCQWGASWYEGYQDDRASSTTHEGVTFEKVYWESPSGGNNKNSLGSTVCFYRTTRHNEIYLTQNSWGGVSYPDGDHWQDGSWEGGNGRWCYAFNEQVCGFNYPVTPT